MIEFRLDEGRIKLGHERLKKAYRLEMPDEIPVVEIAKVPQDYGV